MNKVGENIFDIPKAKDEEGSLWKQNSSFSSGNIGGVDTSSLDSWQDELDNDEIEWIDFLTYQNFEKKYMQSASYPKSPYPIRAPKQVSEWMKVLLKKYEEESKLHKIIENEKIRVMNCKEVDVISHLHLINHF